MKHLRIYIKVIVFIFAAVQARAQHIQLKASVDRNSILIGEPIRLTLEGEFPGNVAHNWFDLDSLAHFDIISREAIDTSGQGNEQFLKQVLNITSFDSGSWTIPMLSLRVGDNNYLTDSIRIEVGYTNADPNQPYHDIRDIIEVPEQKNWWPYYILAAATLLVLGLLVWWLLKRKKKPVAEKPLEKPPLSPIEKARQSLKALEGAPVATQQQQKLYYSALNDILREYVLAKKLLRSPDASNRDLMYAIQQKLGDEQRQSLAKALVLADAAKFAKYAPTASDHHDSFVSIRSSIEKIEQFDN